MKRQIEIEVKNWQTDVLSVGDYIEYQGQLLVFQGYEYGTYPFAKNLSTGEQIQLPHY